MFVVFVDYFKRRLESLDSHCCCDWTLTLRLSIVFFCVLKSKRSTRLWDKVPGCNVCQRSSAGVKHVPFTLSKTFQTCLKSSRPVVRCISEWEAKAKNCKLSSMLFVRVICRPRDWLISMDNGYELLSNVHKSIGIRYSCFFRDFTWSSPFSKKKKKTVWKFYQITIFKANQGMPSLSIKWILLNALCAIWMAMISAFLSLLHISSQRVC